MKITTAYVFTWISSALAISVAIVITKSAAPLWALFIPVFLKISSGDKK